MDLKAGRNLITFEATAITYGNHVQRDPIYIKSIEIQGIFWHLFLC